jgi:hypothetical protein
MVTAPAQRRLGQYAGYELSTGAGPLTAYIPRADVPLVKQVMETEGSWKA